MKIIKIINSPRKNKRFRVFLDNGEKFDFGLDTGKAYIDHGNKKKRDAYIKRHLGNETERYLIENLIPSPSLFSAFILWGNNTDLIKNIEKLNKMWDK
jgi:hypothetical protein